MCPIAEPEAGVYEGAEPYDSYLWASSNVSPIAFMEQNVNHRENINVNSSAYLKIDLLKGLKLEATGSYIFSSQHRRIFTPSSVLKNGKWVKDIIQVQIVLIHVPINICSKRY